MHELAIAHSLLEAVRAQAGRRPGSRIVKVGVKVGELAGVDPEALSFSFEALVQESELAPLTLDIERCPRRQRCPHCQSVFVVEGYDLACPGCGVRETQCIGGDELDLAYLEVEES